MPQTSKRPRRLQRLLLLIVASLVTLIAVFYLEEDWRGKRAWVQRRAALEARGVAVDWDKLIPQPVPDDQNFFTASTNILLRFHKAQTQAELAAAALLPPLYPVASNTFPVFNSAKTKPLVVAEFAFPVLAAGRAPASTMTVAKLNDPATPDLVRNTIRKTVGLGLHGATDIQFSEFQLSNLAPAQFAFKADSHPTLADVENLVPADLVTNLGRLQVVAGGQSETFQILLTNVQVTAAADYLKWSDQFVPLLDEVREALKRPYALLPGDYSEPYLIPIPNFVTLRAVAQMLAQRAQCHLLLGDPDEACREITLLHESCKILEKPPTGKPETLVESMINVAITGLFVNTIADGLRLGAWRESHLTAFQDQLKDTALPAWVAESFREEFAATVRTFEATPAYKFVDVISSSGPSGKSASVWIRFKNPLYLFLKFAPRGWIYQNLVSIADLEPKPLDSFDLEHNTIVPGIFDQADRNLDKFFLHPSPFKTLASMALPNFTKAVQTTAYNQTLVNEAQIVCALERYHLARGEYPATLDTLVPQLIEKLPHDLIGGQPLQYRRSEGGKFLLYSVGWNERNDGGRIALNKDGAEDRLNGDWVWR